MTRHPMPCRVLLALDSDGLRRAWNVAGGSVWLVNDVEAWITEHQPWKARGADEPPPSEI